ncbi:MAG: type II toxin-antitoxin system HicB family antitoxin [Coriobacteriia bacterium]|nr:type II toxin-antitoxin system HicB family antitoxin [Coriobacteriia bacterium]MCL2746783.1 type II toxin-antitoxin system HicB family antitoxin [Coriobacteriia bacterium]MCL2870891.1 type II toxin-antitoxin system HicB family antitoxin [Coriobacteriia bacterium]
MRYTYEALFEAEEDGGYSVHFPDIPEICTCGDNLTDAVLMASDALELWIVSERHDGKRLPKATFGNGRGGCLRIAVSISPRTESEVIDERVTTTEAARRLGVTQGRIRQMIAAQELDAVKKGRDNLVSTSSISAKIESPRQVGRPRKHRALA